MSWHDFEMFVFREVSEFMSGGLLVLESWVDGADGVLDLTVVYIRSGTARILQKTKWLKTSPMKCS